ncbi:MAG: DUF4293 domain-containing protein [Saprospiraceae bacterium]|nr:DUF4293 domain-containing protein [Saprospiraceae bacterium]MDW8483056.1 DUF4293 domain-containing protein [Saprospiraceae bacterium]
MIQRIQTLWLLAALGAVGAAFALPLLKAPEGDAARTIEVLADGALTLTDNPGLLGLSVIGGVTALIATFLYKNRPLQARLALAGAGIGVLWAGLVILAVNMAHHEMPQPANTTIGGGVALPIVYGLFCWLAARAIRRDEALVRSMERLR